MDDALDRSLRNAHRTVLAMIAGCAVLSVLQPGADPEPAPEPTTTTVAVVLALATILTRRSATSPVVEPRTSLVLLLSSYACAFALAALGSFIAMTQGQKETGLVFALAAGIFCLRPPPRLASE